MEWSARFGRDHEPTFAQIDAFIDNPLWPKMNAFLQQRYGAQPLIDYSGCTGQPGWNVKYQKSGRSLCTLYPMRGYFIALVVIGAKQEPEAALMIPSCGAYVRGLYAQAPQCMGKWLMIHVTDEQILEDAKALIGLRAKPGR